ncbi:DNA topoisomerase [Vibrio europaeus]|uniref:DNA topoisomerase n=1 Tax=Vibrio europaeus TaxID=300876 RepID=UPI00233E61A7|nr:DNA topoisomerase [Vibrio europaeus]MDC5870295.1 DNA topoisomerase [Vibrio europaeus]
MQVYLCEKASQGKAIAAFLGMTATHKKKNHYEKNNVAVAWSSGHIFELKPPEHYNEAIKKQWKFDQLPVIPTDLNFEYVLKDSYKGLFKSLKALLKRATEVTIATDPDPEGERIAYNIIKFAGYKGKLTRVLYSSTDDAALTKAWENKLPAEETEYLYHVSDARSMGDWIVGMNMTMALTLVEQKKLRNQMKSAYRSGRVKSATAELVAIREIDIKNFKPVDHYGVKILAKTQDGHAIELIWDIPDQFKKDGRLLDKNVAQQVVEYVKHQSAVVRSAVKEEKSTKAPLPFSQTKLQVACDKYKIAPDETLQIAQTLYEKPLSNQTYPRTGIEHLPEGMHGDAKQTIENLMALDAFAKFKPLLDPSKKSRAWNDKKVKVHHGIIPTSKAVDFDKFTEHQKIIFALVAKRYLCQFAPDYVYESTAITVQAGNLTFKASCNVPLKLGWKQIEKDVEEGGASNELPSVSTNQPLTIVGAEIVSKKTTAPKRYTQASLVNAMMNIANEVDDKAAKAQLRDQDGIGTEATRATTVKELVKSGMVLEKTRKLHASERLLKMREFTPIELRDPVTSATWERAFEAIQLGKMDKMHFVTLQSKLVTYWVGQLNTQHMQRKRK